MAEDADVKSSLAITSHDLHHGAPSEARMCAYRMIQTSL